MGKSLGKSSNRYFVRWSDLMSHLGALRHYLGVGFPPHRILYLMVIHKGFIYGKISDSGWEKEEALGFLFHTKDFKL